MMDNVDNRGSRNILQKVVAEKKVIQEPEYVYKHNVSKNPKSLKDNIL